MVVGAQEHRDAEAEFRDERHRRVKGGAGAFLTGLSIRLPPANIEAEQAVLGGLMARNDSYSRISGFLRPEHFADPIHGEIYRRIGERIDQGAVADAVTLRSDLEGTSILDEVGGTRYLGQLLGAMIGIINIPDYARLILETYIRRQIIDACEAVANQAFGMDGAPNALRLITELRMMLVAIEGHVESPDNLRSIANAVSLAIEAGKAAAQRGDGLSGPSCGFGAMDQFIGGLEPGTNTVLGARPGVGKTALAVQMAMRMAQKGYRILYISLEMAAYKLGRRALSLAARVPLKELRAGSFEFDDSLAEDVVKGQKVFESLPLLIADEPRLTMDAITTRANLAKRKFGRLDAIFIDHLHILGKNDRLSRMQDVQAIAEQTGAIMALTKRMEIPAVTLAQLSRGVESRDDKRPTIADLRGSGAIEQDADTIGMMYRPEAGMRPPERKQGEGEGDFIVRQQHYQRRLDEVRGKAWVYFDKVRDGEGGVAELGFDGTYTRFFEKDREQR
jgi:replicative DNA helicase